MTKDTDGTIEVRDRRKAKRFVIDNAIIDIYGPLVGPYGLAIYMALCRHANGNTQQAFPRVKTLVAETGMSERKAHDVIQHLCQVGLIRHESGKAEGARNVYHILEVHDDPEKQKAYALTYGYLPNDEQEGYAPGAEGCAPRTEGYAPDAEGCAPHAEGYAPRTEASEQTYLTNTPDNLTQDSAGDGASASPEHPPPKSKPKRSPKQQARDAMSNALLWVVFRLAPDQFEMLSSADKSNLRRQTTKWLKQGKAPEDVRAFGEWWDRRDWRGREGQRPEFRHLGAEWGTFEQQRKQQERTDNGNPKQQRQTTDRRGDDPGDDYPTLDPARFEPAPSRAS